MTAADPSLRRLSYPLKPRPFSEPSDFYLLPLSAISTSGTGSYEYKAEVLNATRSRDTTGQRLRTPQEGIREDIESVTFGKYQAPSQFETTGSTTFATDNETFTISGDAITIGVTVYTKIPPTGEWKVETRDSVPETPLDRMPINPSLLSNLAVVEEEQLDGVDVLHLVALVPPGMDIGLADPRLDRRVEYWIGKDDHLIRRYVFTGTSPGEGGEVVSFV